MKRDDLIAKLLELPEEAEIWVTIGYDEESYPAEGVDYSTETGRVFLF